ncbi:MAG: hypothetical protein U9N41_04225 [Euryarchaeota archaeon]|nr:hypothetical protein [Euryarchaeota archaeon]
MITEKKDISELSHKEKKKIEDAEKSYRKMWEEIKPFIRERTRKQYSTTGEWKISSYEEG